LINHDLLYGLPSRNAQSVMARLLCVLTADSVAITRLVVGGKVSLNMGKRLRYEKARAKL
jgi:coproporphyrinogen III oxidase-like Fe-S oxidoreductase